MEKHIHVSDFGLEAEVLAKVKVIFLPHTNHASNKEGYKFIRRGFQPVVSTNVISLLYDPMFSSFSYILKCDNLNTYIERVQYRKLNNKHLKMVHKLTGITE